jgi:sterol desaturase/sphingolipid hydroxylase (fatty acid hydroxylase superfamily)
MKKIIFWEPPLWLIVGVYGVLAALCYADLASFVVGLIGGQFLEYVKHRWLMHGVLVAYHRVHHIDARKYSVLPLAVPPLAIAGLYLLVPVAYLSGTIAGYVIYEIVHRLSPPWHNEHHKNPKKSYGVSTPLLDWMFGTR